VNTHAHIRTHWANAGLMREKEEEPTRSERPFLNRVAYRANGSNCSTVPPPGGSEREREREIKTTGGRTPIRVTYSTLLEHFFYPFSPGARRSRISRVFRARRVASSVGHRIMTATGSVSALHFFLPFFFFFFFCT